MQTTDSRPQTEALRKNPIHPVILSGQLKKQSQFLGKDTEWQKHAQKVSKNVKIYQIRPNTRANRRKMNQNGVKKCNKWHLFVVSSEKTKPIRHKDCRTSSSALDRKPENPKLVLGEAEWIRNPKGR